MYNFYLCVHLRCVIYIYRNYTYKCCTKAVLNNNNNNKII